MRLKRAKVSWQMGWEIRFRSEGFSKGTKTKIAREVRNAVDAAASLRDLDFDHLRGYLVIGQNAFQNASLPRAAQSLNVPGEGGR